MVWGINLPRWRFSDLLPIFKLVIDPNTKANLDTLASKYAPWFQHIHHDAESDSRALMHVVTRVIDKWQVAYMSFSSPYEHYITSVRLNTFKVRPPLPFSSSQPITNDDFNTATKVCTTISIISEF